MFLLGVACGFVLGAAFPGVLRKIRAYFQKKAAEVKTKL